jgi:peptide/nickel transport system substrate-binding protein
MDLATMRPRRVASWAAAGIALIAGLGCGSEGTCEEWCGTMVVVFYADANTLFPPVVSSDTETALTDFLFLKLADIGPELTTTGTDGFVPRLARTWQVDDPRTITFSLDPNARWHDGVAVTAADVAFTFDVYRDPAVNATISPRLKDIESVTARDSLAVVFRFRRSYAEQFFDAVYHMRIVPQHLLASVPRADLATLPFVRNPVGNGPFRFVRWTAGESGELAADSAFFLGRPGVRRLVWRVAPDRAAALTQLVTREADVLSYVFPTAANLRLVNETEHLRLIPYPSNAYSYIGFNFRDPEQPERAHPLFADRELRRAIAMAIDRETVVRAILGEYGEVPPGPLTRVSWIWRDDITQLPYDTVRASRMLRDLGWRDTDGDGVRDRAGRPLRFELVVPGSSSARVQASVIVQAQLKELGIDMVIGEYEFNAFIDRIEAGRFDAQFSSIGQDPSPVAMEDWTSAGVGSLNYGSYTNPTVDQLVSEALETTDRDAASAQWKNVLEMMNADAPAIWIVVPQTLAGVDSRLRNVTLQPDAWWTTIWTWRVAPADAIARDLAGGR